MINRSSVMLGMALVLGSAHAFAQSEAGRKVRLGVGVGFAMPLGDLSTAPLSYDITRQVPVSLEAGYFIAPHLLIGAYGQYGFAAGGEDSGDGTVRDVSFGIQAQYHAAPRAGIDPWLGLGVGYEILSNRSEQGDMVARGLELARLQAGLDLRVAPAFTLGPFLGLSLDEYTHYKLTRDTYTAFDGAIHPRGFHEWPTVGVKGTFAP
jgi:outer membrane protein W